MTVRRVVTDLTVSGSDLGPATDFYTRVVGMRVAMDHGWIRTLVDPGDSNVQLSLMTHDATAALPPAFSVEVDDVDAAYAACQARGDEIVHPLTDEEWGVRRFFVRDPAGTVVNVLSHRGPATASAPRVLVIGLDPYRVPGPWDPKPAADAIAASMAALAERGLAAESCLVGLDGSDDVEAVVSAALRAHPWDCVLVGGGIRKAEDLLELFETIINLARRGAPGASIAFNRSVDDIADAVFRWEDSAVRPGRS